MPIMAVELLVTYSLVWRAFGIEMPGRGREPSDFTVLRRIGVWKYWGMWLCDRMMTGGVG